jgi:hypothetical protein
LFAIIALTSLAPDFVIDTPTLIFGGLAYIFLYLMTATSFDRSAAWIGRTAWTRLHKTGAYTLWLVFTISYVPRALESAAFLAPALLCLAALGIRIAARNPRAARR